MIAEVTEDSDPPPRYAACLPAFLGAVAALVLGLVGVVVWLAIHRIPILDDREFDAAYAAWRDHGPRPLRN